MRRLSLDKPLLDAMATSVVAGVAETMRPLEEISYSVPKGSR
jgi:hypothetical protein